MNGAPHFDIAIIGAGILGLATGYQLLEALPDLRIVILEREESAGAHQSSHNSGVVHAGVYYSPGSLKARLCREGAQLLYDFADRHNIPYGRTGKLIVQVSDAEAARFDSLCARAAANGVPGIEVLDKERIAGIEPYVSAVRGLWSPNTGVIDYKVVCDKLVSEIEVRGGQILLGTEVTKIVEHGRDVVIQSNQSEVAARNVISCAGLWADRVSALSGETKDLMIVPFRGSYYTLAPQSRDLVRGLVYPVPDPALPFLGVHFTRRLDGEVLVGPNAVLALARDGYGRGDISARDLACVLGYRGFWRMASRYVRAGLVEMWRDVSKRAYLAQVQRYIPSLTGEDLRPGPSGVRAQAVTRSGVLMDDFSFIGSSHIIHVQNAPSPAATSSLAIGRLLAERSLDQFGILAR